MYPTASGTSRLGSSLNREGMPLARISQLTAPPAAPTASRMPKGSRLGTAPGFCVRPICRVRTSPRQQTAAANRQSPTIIALREAPPSIPAWAEKGASFNRCPSLRKAGANRAETLFCTGSRGFSRTFSAGRTRGGSWSSGSFWAGIAWGAGCSARILSTSIWNFPDSSDGGV